MTMPAQRKAPNANTAMTKRDVVRLFQKVGNPEQLDISHHEVRGIALLNGNLRGANLSQASVCEANLCGADLSNTDLRGADLSWACFGDASDDDQLKQQLWRRGALFREAPKVRVAGRLSAGAGRHALGFLLMSVVGFLCLVGLRVLRFSLWLKRNKELARVASRKGGRSSPRHERGWSTRPTSQISLSAAITHIFGSLQRVQA
jgi:hypothetical protein